MTQNQDVGGLDAETLQEFKGKILDDINEKGINEVVIDTVMSLFAMEAFARNLSCVTNSIISLALKKKVFDKDEFSKELQEELDKVSQQLDDLISSIENEKTN